jgi:hypothetical protein
MASRLPNPLFLALMLPILAFGFGCFMYDLYSAWTYHQVFVGFRDSKMFGVGGWISADRHPTAFWWTVVRDCVVVFVVVVIVPIAIIRKSMKPGRSPRRPTLPG